MKFIKTLLELKSSDTPVAGGKGASLGEMTRAGIPVPSGFVILVDAFEKFLSDADLQQEIRAELAKVDKQKMHTVEYASERIQKMILLAKMPKDIALAIEKNFAMLSESGSGISSGSGSGTATVPDPLLDSENEERGQVHENVPDPDSEVRKIPKFFVAVRSSATAEDSQSAAWAGQLDSFLNTTEETLLENVKRCWASLFTPRAIFYRMEQGLEESHVSVAVVVQAMIQSEVSGIAFSVHPVTEDPDQLIIEAGWGLGEAIVSGSITPDSYVVSKKEQKILDCNVVEQEKMLVKSTQTYADLGSTQTHADGRNHWIPVPVQKRTRQKLTNSQILELSEIIKTIESHYGFPCDIEWAFLKGKFFIVQSRPITTLQDGMDKGKGAKVLECAERKEDKELNVVKLFFLKSLGEEISPALYNGSIFIQSSGWNTKKYFEKYYQEDTSFPLLISIKEGEGIYYYSFAKAKQCSREVFLAYWKDTQIVKDRRSFFRETDIFIKNLYEKFTPNYIQNTKESLLRNEVNIIRDKAWEINAALFFSIAFDKELCVSFLKEAQSVITSKKVDVLWEKATEPMFRSFSLRRKHFFFNLKQEGLSWKEIGESCQFFEANYDQVKSSTQVEKILKKDFEKYSSIQMQQEIDRDRAREQKEQKNYARWLKTLTKEERKLVYYIQCIMEFRDVRKDPMARAITIMHRFAQKIFLENNIPNQYLIYTPFDEILKGSKYLNSVQKTFLDYFPERAVLVTQEGMRLEGAQIKHDLLKKEVDVYYASQQKISSYEKNILIGSVGSPGIVCGKVRIIQNYQAQKDFFQKGEILVTGMTRPEFVPLMEKASGIITDEGGITSHAAIVSRELKKPCIIGTKIATQVLHDGDLVEVDAERGVVKILQRAGEGKEKKKL